MEKDEFELTGIEIQSLFAYAENKEARQGVITSSMQKQYRAMLDKRLEHERSNYVSCCASMRAAFKRGTMHKWTKLRNTVKLKGVPGKYLHEYLYCPFCGTAIE